MSLTVFTRSHGPLTIYLIARIGAENHHSQSIGIGFQHNNFNMLDASREDMRHHPGPKVGYAATWRGPAFCRVLKYLPRDNARNR